MVNNANQHSGLLANEEEEAQPNPIDNEMIDHLSQKKDTLRGTVRSCMINNDDIDDVVCQSEEHEEQSIQQAENVESTNYLSNVNTHTNTDVISKKTLFNEEQKAPQFVQSKTISQENENSF
jgi:hypothetical protein